MSSAAFSCGFHVYSSPRENVILFKQVQRTVKLQLYVISNSSFLNFKSQLANPRKQTWSIPKFIFLEC